MHELALHWTLSESDLELLDMKTGLPDQEGSESRMYNAWRVLAMYDAF